MLAVARDSFEHSPATRRSPWGLSQNMHLGAGGLQELDGIVHLMKFCSAG